MNGRCEYVGGCDREASRLFPAQSVKGWLSEEHFQQVLNAAAEKEAAAQRKLDADWQAHFEKYVHENNLDPAELTEAQVRQIIDEFSRINDGARRWVEQVNKKKQQRHASTPHGGKKERRIVRRAAGQARATGKHAALKTAALHLDLTTSLVRCDGGCRNDLRIAVTFYARSRSNRRQGRCTC